MEQSKNKKQVRFAYDVTTIPHGTTAPEIIEIFEKKNVLFYDGTSGHKPIILDDGQLNIMEAKDIEQINEILKILENEDS